MRKLSRPWHGSYRILSKEGPDVTVVKLYFSQDKVIRVHHVGHPLSEWVPSGFHWYETKWHSPGRPPKWVEHLLSEVAEFPSDGNEESDPPATNELAPSANLELPETIEEFESEPVVEAPPATASRSQDCYS